MPFLSVRIQASGADEQEQTELTDKKILCFLCYLVKKWEWRMSGDSPRHPTLAVTKTGKKKKDSELRSQLFEGIEDLDARSAKVFVVAGDDGEVVPAGGSRNVAVFNRHPPACPLQFPLLFGPNVRARSVEAENSSVQRSRKTRQPSLQRLSLLLSLRTR